MQSPQSDLWHGTTILTVRKGGVVAIGGDGQVSIGQTVVKASAHGDPRFSASMSVRMSRLEAVQGR